MRCSKCECLNLEDSTVCFNCGTSLIRSDSPYTSPAASLENPRKGFRPVWIVWGCGGLVLLLVLVLGSCFLAVKGGMAAGEHEFKPAVEAYLSKVRAKDYRGAYQDFGAEMFENVKEEDYLALEAGFQEKLGNIKSKSLQFIQTGVDARGRWGRVVFSTEFEHGNGTIAFGLRKENESWKIINIRYDSPVLLESLKSKNVPKPRSN